MSKKDEIKLDPKNTRIHGEENKALIKKSLKELGTGRSIVVDSEGFVVAGNGVKEQADKMGIKTRIIESDGTDLIVIKRTDLKYDDEKRRKLAIADNAVGETSVFDFTSINEGELEEWGVEKWMEAQIDELEEDEEIELEQSVQLKPPMEYILIMAKPNSEEWNDLKEYLKLKRVRRGGYKKGSVFDVNAEEKVISWFELKKRLKLK